MRKALTLVETMVATIISSMLLLEVGSSFFMFRQMNYESINDTKSELKILEVKDYIANNIDRFIDEELGKSYFRVSYDEIGSNYSLDYQDGICVLQPGSGSIGFEVVEQDCNLNHESIVAFSLPEDYSDQPIYLHTDEGNKQVVKLSPADTIYYSGLDELDIDNNLISYSNGSLDFSGETVFDDLPYKSMTIKLSFDEPEVDEYTVVKVGDEYELLPFTVKSNNPDFGLVTIEDVDTDNHTCKLVAHNFIYDKSIEEIDAEISGEDDSSSESEIPSEEEGSETEGEGEETEEGDEEESQYDEEGNLIKEIIKLFKFEGWEDGDDEFEWEINYLNDPGKEYVANFSDDMIEVTILEESEDTQENEEAAENMLYALEGSLKNTTVTKKVYVLKCTIEYEDKNGVSRLPFVAGLFEKYLPEIYKGEE